MNLALRDRDVKTQRRKEANRESARRSKQRKKEESEILSSKAQELVRESTSLRADLERVQKHADKLYAENVALRSQVARFGGALSPSPARVVPVKMPPPIDFSLSLWKEAGDPSIAVKKEPSPSGGSNSDSDGESEQNNPVSATVPPADVPGEGDIDLPSLLESHMTNTEAAGHADHFAQLPLSLNVGPAGYPHLGTNSGDAEASVDMLMSEAIVSFREPPENTSLFFRSSALDNNDSILRRAFRNAQFAPEGLDGKATSRRSLDVSTVAEHFDLVRRSEIGQGG